MMKEVESESDVNEFENPSDSRFARNCQNLTALGFDLHEILGLWVLEP